MSSVNLFHFGIGGRIIRRLAGTTLEQTFATAAPKPDAVAEIKAIAAATPCRNPRRFTDLF